MRISRRHFITAAAAASLARPSLVLASPPPPPLPAGDNLSFRIMRKGERIGTHALTFVPTENGFTVNVAVEIAVKIAFITVFRYTHANAEHWQNGQWIGMESKTNDDGTAAFSHAWLQDGQMLVEGSKAPRYTAPPNAVPSTHWNMAELSNPMINPQNGELLEPKVADQGDEQIPTASGAKIASRHYHLSQMKDSSDLDLWYDAQHNWSYLSFAGSDGTIITYERL